LASTTLSPVLLTITRGNVVESHATQSAANATKAGSDLPSFMIILALSVFPLWRQAPTTHTSADPAPDFAERIGRGHFEPVHRPTTRFAGPSPPEAMMRFYSGQPRFYCGVDLHTRTLSLCVFDAAGAVALEATLPPEPERLLVASAP
jgi:hypothetical protein